MALSAHAGNGAVARLAVSHGLHNMLEAVLDLLRFGFTFKERHIVSMEDYGLEVLFACPKLMAWDFLRNAVEEGDFLTSFYPAGPCFCHAHTDQ